MNSQELTKKVLSNINKGRFYPENFDFEIDYETTAIVLKSANDNGLITGISFPKIMNQPNGYKASTSTKLTLEGLDYLQST